MYTNIQPRILGWLGCTYARGFEETDLSARNLRAIPSPLAIHHDHPDLNTIIAPTIPLSINFHMRHACDFGLSLSLYVHIS